jgi:hypothetical protein
MEAGGARAVQMWLGGHRAGLCCSRVRGVCVPWGRENVQVAAWKQQRRLQRRQHMVAFLTSAGSAVTSVARVASSALHVHARCWAASKVQCSDFDAQWVWRLRPHDCSAPQLRLR